MSLWSRAERVSPCRVSKSYDDTFALDDSQPPLGRLFNHTLYSPLELPTDEILAPGRSVIYSVVGIQCKLYFLLAREGVRKEKEKLGLKSEPRENPRSSQTVRRNVNPDSKREFAVRKVSTDQTNDDGINSDLPHF